MTADRPKVFVTRKLPAPVEARMGELFDATLNTSDAARSRAEIEEAARTADVLVPTLGDPIDEALIAGAGPQLKLIANFGAGVDHIDVKAATARGITVTNTPGVLTADTADMTMALMLAVPRRMKEGAEAMRRGTFKGWAPTWMLGRRLKGKKLGIIGMGRVGQAVARRARAFGLQIHYHNRSPVNPHVEEELEAAYWDSLDRMAPEMDIVSVNCPSTPATFHLLNARRLKLLKPDCIIINTARGEVIDEAAMTEMLIAGELGGAGLDVFEHEPAVDPKLRDLPNVLLMPHLGSATVESRVEMGEKVLINIRIFFDGHKPPDRVIPGML
ncbi:MAG: D-glycerate dehydrogenase [Pseudomonadota bacterium]